MHKSSCCCKIAVMIAAASLGAVRGRASLSPRMDEAVHQRAARNRAKYEAIRCGGDSADGGSFSLPQVGGWWRSVRVQGKGRGAAVLQLTSKYHVSDASALLSAPTAAFHLRTRATWHGHNGSALTFTTCTRWLFQEASDASGVAVLEVTVPTGYGASAAALQAYVASRAVPNLRRADFHQRKVTFYFEKVNSKGSDLLVLILILIA